MKRIRKIIIFIVLPLLLCTKKRSDISEEEHEFLNQYLGKSNEQIDIYKDQNFVKLYNISDSVKIIFFGIKHGFEINNMLDVKLFKSLLHGRKIKYYLGEFDYVVGWYLNKYLRTGKKEILDAVFSVHENAYLGTESNFQKWERMYLIYKELPSNEKFKIMGFDVTSSPLMTFHYFKMLFKDRKLSEGVKPFVESILKINHNRVFNERITKEFVLQWQNLLSEKEIEFKNCLGDEFFGFKLTFSNFKKIIALSEIRRKHTDPGFGVEYLSNREEYLFDNVRQILGKFKEGNFYSQIGRAHVLQEQENNFEPLAKKLEKNIPFLKNKIISLYTVYDNSKQLIKYVEGSSMDKIEFCNEEDFTLFFGTLIGSPAEMFWLSGKESPFNKKLYFFNRGPKNSVTTDFIDCIIVVSDSEASKSYTSK